MQCDLGDVSIYYETHGAGRPIVLLPGQPSDHRLMERFMEPVFAQRAGWLRLYPDLPGTGRSPGAERLTSADAMLGALLAFIDQMLPGQRFVLAGLSYGGFMARGVLYHRAEMIDGLLLCVPQVKANAADAQLPPRRAVVADPALAAQLGGIADLIVVQDEPTAAAARDILAQVRIADHAFLARLEAAGGLSIDVDRPPAPFERPTLIITARQDHLCGYQDAWDLLATYPRATFAVLDRAGHLIDIEQPTLCHALIGEWLDRVVEGAGPLPQPLP
jgi:pimeloyl-ACP methyl ester carboxylesterase